MWKKIAIVIEVSVAVLIIITLIISFTTDTGGSDPTQPSGWGVAITFAIFIGVLIAIVVWAYYEHNKQWDQVITDNGVVAMFGVLLLNAASYILHYQTWRKFYDTGNLFWFTNISVVLITYLLFKKGATSKIVAVVLAFLVLAAIKDQYDFQFWSGQDGATITRGIPTAPMEIARAVIGDCESGDGSPGSARQFEPGTTTPISNKEGSSAFGKYQFLEKYREPAAKLGFDLNTEEGQDSYFAYRYERYGTRDWEDDPRSVACWGPKLARSGFQREYVLNFEVTDEGWEEKDLPVGFNAWWGDSEGAFVVENEKGLQARFDPENNVFENLPFPKKKGKEKGFSKKLKFRSLRKESAKVSLRITKQAN